MIGLPRSLAPWSRELGLFPGELAELLGELIARIAPVVGPLTFEGHDESGEPDGFDGIARRGSYDRLLASEWALATIAPDEFLRRAVAGEQAFFALGRKSTARARTSVASPRSPRTPTPRDWADELLSEAPCRLTKVSSPSGSARAAPAHRASPAEPPRPHPHPPPGSA